MAYHKDEKKKLRTKEPFKVVALHYVLHIFFEESEKFIASMIKKYNLNCKYVIVSEAGASIYSASKVAIEEFPDLAVEKRSAVSIGRRLQDPLSELVKIPPEGIGVGLYQHDVSSKKLSDNLDFVVSKAVNSVGLLYLNMYPELLKKI